MNVMARIDQFSKEAKVDSLRPIGENPRFAEAQAKLAKFQGELRGLREAIDRENAAWYAKQSGSIDGDAIGRADRMLDGQSLDDDRDTQTKLRELGSKIEVLRPAIVKQSELVDRIHGELSIETGKTAQARHRKALANILEAARALVAAATAERAIRGELMDRGFETLDTFTPAPQLATPLILGDESFYDSAIAHFARQLKDLGILP